ncbi:helix-turn-helix domain-containing protein [Oligoflexia bacterium]|nr:helix-turn-helix domain-containing protein [Oligoflexia bacterium]
MKIWSSGHMEHLITSPKSLGNAIRTVRKRAGLTQKELGDQLGMDQATVSYIERGNPGSRLDTILHLLSVLDLAMELRPRKGVTPQSGEW